MAARDQPPPRIESSQLRRTFAVVALLNFSYFFAEFAAAVVAGSVALLADSVDFLEDTAINLLSLIALGWPLAKRAAAGKVMALVILGPAAVSAWEAVRRFSAPVAPEVLPIVLASLGAIAINGTSAWLLTRTRHHAGSLSRAAFLSARNDVLVNIAIIAMARSHPVDRFGLAGSASRVRNHPARPARGPGGLGGQRRGKARG